MTEVLQKSITNNLTNEGNANKTKDTLCWQSLLNLGSVGRQKPSCVGDKHRAVWETLTELSGDEHQAVWETNTYMCDRPH